jgi:hypothetical protein
LFLITVPIRINKNGDFLSAPVREKWLCGPRVSDVEDLIKRELEFVQTETQSKVKKLRLATEVHIGES